MTPWQCPVLRARQQKQREDVAVLIKQHNAELAALGIPNSSSSSHILSPQSESNYPESESGFIEQITSRARALASRRNNEQLSYKQRRSKSIDEMQEKNRRHPGLRPHAHEIRKIRLDLGFDDDNNNFGSAYHTAFLNAATPPPLSLHEPFDITSSATEHAQAATLSSLAAVNRIAATEPMGARHASRTAYSRPRPYPAPRTSVHPEPHRQHVSMVQVQGTQTSGPSTSLFHHRLAPVKEGRHERSDSAISTPTAAETQPKAS